jgi:hypothetical protein
VTVTAYEKYDYPWYKIYDENSTAISGTDNFIPVKSVHDIDNIRFVHKHPGLVSLNPDTPPPCTSHSESTSVCVFRPCNHSACTACLGMAMVGNPECPICSAVILKFVGFKKPIAKVHAVSGEPEDKEWAVEQRIVGVRADEDADNVITLFLAEDAVSGFHGSASIGARHAMYLTNVIHTNLMHRMRDDFEVRIATSSCSSVCNNTCILRRDSQQQNLLFVCPPSPIL